MTKVEQMLLKQVKDRPKLYNKISQHHQTQAIAVILILHVEKQNPSKVMLSGELIDFDETPSPPDVKISRRSLLKSEMSEMSTFSRRSLLKSEESTQSFKTFTSNTTMASRFRLDPIDELSIIQSVRQTFRANGIFQESVTPHYQKGNALTLIKVDDRRFFCLAHDPVTAMDKMIHAKKLVQDLQEKYNRVEANISLSISGGCEYGGIFELTNDYFGDPVNIASKLGEDTAEPGELFVSFGGHELKYIESMKHKVDFEPHTVEISGVEIEYYAMNEKYGQRYIQGERSVVEFNRCGGLMNFFKRSKKPSNATASSPRNVEVLNSPRSESTYNWEELIMLQSDLSGFTRLTKKYGILHFLTLILDCRTIFNRHLEKCTGALLKYDGDNIICKFESTDAAIQFTLRIAQDFEKYNEGKEKDYQIRAKIGIAKGLVLVSDDLDIAGDAWEECCELGEELGKVGEVLVTEAIKSDLKRIPSNCTFELREGNEEVPSHYNIKWT